MVDEESLSYLYAKKKNNIYAQIIQFFWKKKMTKESNKYYIFEFFNSILSLQENFEFGNLWLWLDSGIGICIFWPVMAK